MSRQASTFRPNQGGSSHGPDTASQKSSIVSIGLPAVILGHAAAADTRNNAKSGRGMAVAGLALGYVSLAPAIILFFWFGLALIGGAGGTAVPDPSATPTR